MELNKSVLQFGIIFMGILSLFIFGFKAEATEWKLFQATPTGDIYYYDPTSVKRFPNDILSVWVRIIETTEFSKKDLEKLKDSKRANDVIKEAQKKSKGESKHLFEINCSANMVRVLKATLYDTKGTIKEDYESPSEWVPIPKNSVTNYLTEILCH